MSLPTAATVALLLSTPALSQPPMTFDDLLGPAYKQVKQPGGPTKKGPGVMWRYRVAPPLPSEWPMTATSTTVYWVYAAGLDLDLHDGERVAAPWARVDVKADGTKTLTVVSKALEVIGTQGVQPITRAEADLAAGVFRPARTAAEVEERRASWRLWLRYNGVIAAKLNQRHEAFFAAVTNEHRAPTESGFKR